MAPGVTVYEFAKLVSVININPGISCIIPDYTRNMNIGKVIAILSPNYFLASGRSRFMMGILEILMR